MWKGGGQRGGSKGYEVEEVPVSVHEAMEVRGAGEEKVVEGLQWG